MITRLVRWPNGTLSIVSGEDEPSLIKQLTKDGVGNVEENDSPHGMVIDVPAGSRYLSLPRSRSGTLSTSPPAFTTGWR